MALPCLGTGDLCWADRAWVIAEADMLNRSYHCVRRMRRVREVWPGMAWRKQQRWQREREPRQKSYTPKSVHRMGHLASGEGGESCGRWESPHWAPNALG